MFLINVRNNLEKHIRKILNFLKLEILEKIQNFKFKTL